MRFVEVEGKTVEEAVEQALQQLSVKREEVTVEVLDEGSKGLFGLGGKNAHVKVTVLSKGAERIEEITQKILELMKLPSKTTVTQEADRVLVDIHDSHNGLLIGRRAQALHALETLLNRMVNRREGERCRIVVDVEGYRNRRGKKLADMARQAAEKARGTNQEVIFDPMDAADRRILHMVLKDEPGVVTESRGQDQNRRVVVKPTFAEKNEVN